MTCAENDQLRARIAELEAERTALMNRLSLLSIPNAGYARASGFDMTSMARIAELEAELADARRINEEAYAVHAAAAVLAEREVACQFMDAVTRNMYLKSRPAP